MAVEYVECDGRWWGQQWDPTAQWFCWWLAAGDGSQLGHTPSGALRGPLVDVPVIMLDKFQQSWFLLWSSSPCRMCSGSSTECWTFQLGTSLAMHSAHCTGPWSSTGPGSWCGVVRSLLCNNRCRCQFFSHTSFDSGYMFCVYLVRFGRISHIFYVKAVVRP